MLASHSATIGAFEVSTPRSMRTEFNAPLARRIWNGRTWCRESADVGRASRILAMLRLGQSVRPLAHIKD